MICEHEDKVFRVGEDYFTALALDIFHFQYQNNSVYRSFCDALGIVPSSVGNIAQIPFLPIRFFKSHDVCSTQFSAEKVFESSGTTGSVNSRHLVRDLRIYEHSFQQGFNLFYGKPEDYVIIGLLPSYLERNNSSLVYMVDGLIRSGNHEASGFYLDNFAALATHLRMLEQSGQKVLLIGVTFALLDFAAQFPMPLSSTIIMETGGMKGRRRELTREEVHETLKQAFGVPGIHSEYGMTELLSQGYSFGAGRFFCPPWMKILIRKEDDPLEVVANATPGRAVTGLINVIDLANIYSCSFIATDDIGTLHQDGSFEVLGRMDHADARGCSLMLATV